MSELHKKNPMRTLIFLVLSMVTVGLCVLFARDMSHLNKAYADIMQVEAISSTTQRQISLAENNEHQQREIFNITALTEKALSIDGEEVLSLMSDEKIALLASHVLDEWVKIEAMLTVNWNLDEGEPQKELDYIALRLARDAHFSAMTDLSDGISDYTNEINRQISQYQIAIMFLVFVIGLIIFSNVVQISAELMISKEIAHQSQIDTGTGLYTRSRCQELFKKNETISQERSPVIMVFDLNDLKKTNDNLGHRVGDELIGAFAQILKQSCQVHTVVPFLGRYGGDEFVVYYDDLPKNHEIEAYLNEVECLTIKQNERESRFKVSYAVGYAIAEETSEPKISASQLFEKADKAMYMDKKRKKRAENPDHEEQTAKGELDRLS